MKDEFVMVPRELVARIARAGCWPNDADELRAALADQRQGEPVAWQRKSKTEVNRWFDLPAGDLTEAQRLGYEVRPLYTHAYPGEVERLRERGDVNADRANKAVAEGNTLRAQLAERDALLRSARNDLAEWASTYGNVVSTDTYLIVEEIDAHLSASAEPSAPTIHPINMKTVMQAYEQVDHKSLLHGTSNWCASMATALRGVLQGQPSAPVERDELRELLRSMTCSYRSAIQVGYDRITALGGDCDSVDKMLADFPDYAKARAALERKP